MIPLQTKPYQYPSRCFCNLHQITDIHLCYLSFLGSLKIHHTTLPFFIHWCFLPRHLNHGRILHIGLETKMTNIVILFHIDCRLPEDLLNVQNIWFLNMWLSGILQHGLYRSLQHHSKAAMFRIVASYLGKALHHVTEAPDSLSLKILENNTECLVKDVVCVPNNKEVQIHFCEDFHPNLCTYVLVHEILRWQLGDITRSARKQSHHLFLFSALELSRTRKRTSGSLFPWLRRYLSMESRKHVIEMLQSCGYNCNHG